MILDTQKGNNNPQKVSESFLCHLQKEPLCTQWTLDCSSWCQLHSHLYWRCHFVLCLLLHLVNFSPRFSNKLKQL